MNFSEGQLAVTLVVDERQVLEVQVRSTRPPKLAALLGRRTRSDLAKLVPSLFSVCRMGQQACALAALRLEGAPSGRALAQEVIEHHAWHFDVDWPKALGLPPRHLELRKTLEVLRTGVGTLGPFRARLEAVAGLAGAPTDSDGQFLARCRELDHGQRWSQPVVGAPTLAHCEAGLASQPDFAARPGALEVGPLARVFSHERVQGWAAEDGWGLLTRARARALDALNALDRLETQNFPALDALQINSGTAAALVEVARGPLVHRIECVEDRPVAWGSVAPTEWTFHPDGALRSLQGSLAPAVQDRARMLVTLLDPCVSCSLEVVHA